MDRDADARDVDEFIEAAERFLAERYEHRATPDRFTWGVGDDKVGLLSDHEDDGPASVKAALAWRREKWAGGYGWISGPVEWGGAGLPTEFARRFAALEAEFDTPSEEPLGIGLNIVGPTLLAFGSPEHHQIAADLYAGRVHVCQLFSEPEAGSDLASLRTRAVRHREEWLVTGQKLWSSGAAHSDFGLVLARTGAPEERHRGLTMFVVDMTQDRVVVAPFRQATGAASFNEVHFDDARVPDAMRVGETGDGWQVALHALHEERSAMGAAGEGYGGPALDVQRLAGMLTSAVVEDDPVARDELARVYCDLAAASIVAAKAQQRARHSRPDPVEAAIGKLLLNRGLDAVSAYASARLGMACAVDTGTWGTFAWAEFLMGAPGMQIGGGTAQIMRNIVAERGLGLPRHR